MAVYSMSSKIAFFYRYLVGFHGMAYFMKVHNLLYFEYLVSALSSANSGDILLDVVQSVAE